MVDQVLKSIFGSNLLFAYQVGSTITGEIRPHSDIDFLVCVNQEDLEQSKAFRDFYYQIHQDEKMVADDKYPGEVVSMDTLVGSLNHLLTIKPKRTITDLRTYNGLVWAGMLSDDKKTLVSNQNIDELVRLSNEIIKRWNQELFGMRDNVSTKKLKEGVNYKDGDYIKSQANGIKDCIIKESSTLERILLGYESYETFMDEFTRSIDALNNIGREESFLLGNQVGYISTYLPVNLPLYSLVLYGFIPSLMARRNFIKPPKKASRVVQEINDVLFKDTFGMHIFNGTRFDFIDNFMSHSDVIIFTGKYENAMNLINVVPDSLFIYNGAGINPIVVSEDADLESAIGAVLETRLFNSGQDCAGPDSIIVNKKVYDQFRAMLVSKLSQIKVGDYRDKDNSIGRLVKPIPRVINGHLFEKYKQNITFGSRIDRGNHIIYPTLIEVPLSEEHNYDEFFSPVIWLAEYQDDQELEQYFASQRYSDYAMYVSIFGTCNIEIPNTVILEGKTIMGIDQGNTEYGGYGRKSTFVKDKNGITNKPILISREISEWGGNRDD
jgi:hypothetical protein